MTSYRLPVEETTTSKVSFYFNGEQLSGYEGEPIAAAILANGITVIRYCHVTGEPRGLYCGIGHCYECRADVDSVSNVRTCLTPLKEGMIINSQKGGERVKADVTVIGAGPAGLSSAIEMAKAGLSVIVIDEYFCPGGRLLGQLYEDPKAPKNERLWNGKKIAESLVTEAEELGVKVLCGITSWSISEGWCISISGAEKKTITSDALLLATGAAEKSLPIPGWTLPGVYSIGAAQTLTNVHHIAIGKRVIVVGTDPLALSVVMEMKHAGIDVAGVVLPPNHSPVCPELTSPVANVGRLGEVADLAPNPILRTMGKLASGKLKTLATHALYFDLLKIEGIPVHIRKSIVDITGKNRVESVTLQSVTVDGTPIGKIEKVRVDAVCLSAGLYPLADLAQVAGCPLVDIPELGGIVPVHGPNLSTPVPGMFVAGNITGIEGAKVAIAQGKLAAISIVKSFNKKTSMNVEEAIKEVDLARSLSPINFLKDIKVGRAKMQSYWEKTQIGKELVT